jgi:hypothetical protein
MAITETVLEMHYHRPLLQLFRETYGLGSSGQVNFYKYSPQREAFVGFDQAFAMTDFSDDEFFKHMSSMAMNSKLKPGSRFVAYFLQFKVVKELQKRSKATPIQIGSRPHYRVSLDTTKNDTTGFSQHELLFNLSNSDLGAMVYYACPMIFDKEVLYVKEVDWDDLRLPELNTCPSDFTDNSNHYIYFDQKQAPPIWCSEPTEGGSITAAQFAERVVSQLRELSPEESVERTRRLLLGLKELFSETTTGVRGVAARSGISLFSDALTVVRFDKAPQDRQPQSAGYIDLA